MTRSLKDVVGAVVFQGHPLDAIDILAQEIGIQHFGVTAQWCLIQTLPNKWEWDWLYRCYDRIIENGGQVTFGTYGTPGWLGDPVYNPNWIGEAYPRIGGLPHWQIPIMLEEWISQMMEFIKQLDERFPDVVNYFIGTETNIAGWWENPETKRSGDPEEFVRLVMAPMARYLRAKGKVTFGPGTTLQGERETTFDRAFKHFTTIRKLTRKPNDLLIDHLDMHIYRDDKIGATITDFIRFRDRIANETNAPLQPRISLSEWGFNEGMKHLSIWQRIWYFFIKKDYTGQDAQVDKLKPVLEWLANDPAAKQIFRAMYFSGFDPPVGTLNNTNGLLDSQLKPKKSALLLKKFMI